MASKRSYKNQLETVSAAFSNHLQEKLQRIESIWELIKPGIASGDEPDQQTLRVLGDIAHDLHGEGALFGYPDVTKSAGNLEDTVEQILHKSSHISDQIHNQINACIHELRDAALRDPDMGNALFIDQEAITAIFGFRNRDTLKLRPKQILIIEDADMMRRRIAIGLRQAGFDVHEAAGGTSGIELAMKIIPDLILLDIKMPVVDGFEVQKQIRTHDDLNQVPLIFLTSLGRVNIGQIQTALSYGVTDYISKPFNMLRLIEKIRLNLA